MCGIAGFVGRGAERDAKRMIAAVHHRGPDDTGIYAAPGIGLAHARLSIIDLSPAGHQPMWNKAKTAAIILNGEIYNFEELRASEVPRYPYAGHSDTEVILALYEKYGARCFSMLGGMFALALWDAERETLFLVRDRTGKKPLYWGCFGDTLLFGSEPKALFAHPAAKKEMDLLALNQYLALDYVPTPLSIWKGIEKLPPATVLTYARGEITMGVFWHPDFSEFLMPFPETLARLDTELARAAAERLVSDVPLGVLLSGGLDSSTVAFYAQKAAHEPLHTFSIGFDEPSFDESRYALLVARHLGTQHHHRVVTAQDSLRALPDIIALMDEPLADASIVPTNLLSRFAKESVTAALGGDGGDELFAGYPTFLADRYAALARALPLALPALNLVMQHAPPRERYMSFEFKLRQFLKGAGESDPVERHMRWLGAFSEGERKELLSSDAWHAVEHDDVYQAARDAFLQSTSTDPRTRLLFMYERSYLMDEVLVKVDRASMAHALEVRAPFLDYKLVEFVNRLPYSYKLHGFTTKYMLKRLMRGKLPELIINRTKKGFAVPVGAWINGPLRAWADDLLLGSGGRAGLFKPVYISKLLREHRAGTRDHRKKLWNLLMFFAWYDALLPHGTP
ncbi:asparagine synthase (glutamine-hydrolyzing) [Candidatus Kaiserbacteria bacterium]|nr:asparagine synthase (glutamine-hydrolyzing) [Candidatus Kaiserbacteria bacterium]